MSMLGTILKGGAKLLDKAGDYVTPKTVEQMAKKLGVDLKKFEGASKKDIMKLLNKLNIKVGPTKTGTAVKVGSGVGLGLGGKKVYDDVSEEMGKSPQYLNKGGIVAPKMGGKPSHKAKKSSKSIAKKYFKGTF